MILSIHHIQITVPKGAESEAREFYRGLLNLTEIAKPEPLQARGGFWLQVGDKQVHVGIEDGVDRPRTKAHVAYEVTDLEHWRSVLQSHGIACEDGIPIPGLARFEFRDPFGNRVEMLQRTSD